jgi:hypothetical protein
MAWAEDSGLGMGEGGRGKRKDRGTAGQTRLNSGSLSDTSRASSATVGKLEEQHIQFIRDREKLKTDFDCVREL